MVVVTVTPPTTDETSQGGWSMRKEKEIAARDRLGLFLGGVGDISYKCVSFPLRLEHGNYLGRSRTMWLAAL